MAHVTRESYYVMPKQYCACPTCTAQSYFPELAEETLGPCALYDWDGSDTTASGIELSNVFAIYHLDFTSQMASCAVYFN